MEFKFSNLGRHLPSTVLGLVVVLFCFALVWPLKLAEFADVSPLLLMVVPFLLYGKKPAQNDPDGL